MKPPKKRTKAKHKTTKIVLTPEYDTPAIRARIKDVCERYGTTPIFELETKYDMVMIKGPDEILSETRTFRARELRKAKKNG